MGAYLEVRVLNRRRYAEVSDLLERVATGDGAALTTLLDSTRGALASAEFLRWNGAPSDESFRASCWDALEEAAAQTPSRSLAEEIGQVAVPALCMPEFQWTPGAKERAPTLQPIGDYDGGFYGVIARADPWFEALVMEARGGSHAKYPHGQSMIVLAHSSLLKLAGILEAITPEHCASAFAPDFCLQARGHLAAMVQRCLANPDETLAFSGA